MDILAHGLWTYAIYEYAGRHRARPWTRREKVIAVFFGMMPDLITFTPVFILTLFRKSTTLVAYAETRFVSEWGNTLPNIARWMGHGNLGPPRPSLVPPYVYSLYNLTHSLAIFFFVFVLVWTIRRRPYWLMAGWGLHISIDIWSHTDRFFPTPFLYPFSHLRFNGISWADPTFVVVNYTLLLFVYIYIHKIHVRKRA